MSAFNIKVVKDLQEAKGFWEKFSPRETIFDSWDFRYCFYKYFKNELFFYIGLIGEEVIGLMPLQLNADKEHLEFFGGDYMEDNQVFIKLGHENFIPEFYKNITQKAYLEDIVGSDNFTTSLPLQEYKYILPITGLVNHDDYLQKYFFSDSRHTLKKKIRQMEKEKIEIIENNPADLEVLFDLNILSFKEESTIFKPYRREIYRDLLKLGLPYSLLTFLVNGEKKAVSLSLKYNQSYAFVVMGVDYSKYKHLTIYVNVKNIDRAITSGAEVFDTFTGDCGWKERWHFEKIPQYIYSNI